MYVPASFREERPEVLFDFIDANPLGTLVTTGAQGLYATHLPLVLDRARGVLEGHIARANRHHQMAATEQEVLTIFTGPDAYITPSWYPSKAEHGKVVPTWNYIAVHAYARLRFVEDGPFLRRHLAALTARHEEHRPVPWEVTDAPAEFLAQLERAIIGVELTITRLEGKWKMSQNRPAADIDGVVEGLAGSGDAVQASVARLVEDLRPAR